MATMVTRGDKKRRVSYARSFANVTWGTEPEWSVEWGPSECMARLGSAFNWYRYTCDAVDARNFILDFASQAGGEIGDSVRFLKQLSYSEIPLTVGWLCRMTLRGAKFSEKTKSYLERNLRELISIGKSKVVSDKKKSGLSGNVYGAKKKTETGKKRANIQDLITSKVSPLIAHLEGEIDRFIDNGFKPNGFSIKKWVGDNLSLKPPMYCRKISKWFQPWLAELESARDKTDAYFQECYNHLTRAQLRRLIAFISDIIRGVEMFRLNLKQSRVGYYKRKKKIKTPKEKVSDLQYLSHSDLFGESLDPAKIIFSREVWVLDTKYSIVKVYRTRSSHGLDIKGRAIKFFDKSISECKRIPKDMLPHIVDVIRTGGKVAIRRAFRKSRNKVRPLVTGRLNGNIMILRIFR